MRKELTETEADSFDATFTIRKRKKGEELKEYFALRLDTFKDLVHAGPKVSKDEIQRKYPRFKARYDLDNPEYGVYVAEDKDSVFAGLVLGKTAEKTAWILDIEVKPEFRRHGIGRRLLKQIEGWALKHRRSKISVYLNVHCKAAFRLFQLMNYKVTDYYMEKKIL